MSWFLKCIQFWGFKIVYHKLIEENLKKICVEISYSFLKCYSAHFYIDQSTENFFLSYLVRLIYHIHNIREKRILEKKSFFTNLD